MLKVIVMIDCNICGQPFDRVAVSTERDTLSWKSLSLDLEDEAEDCGWSFYRSAHHCHYCVSDVAFSLRQAADAAQHRSKTSSINPKNCGSELMLNTLFIVDCDRCGQQFDRLAISIQATQNAEAISTLTNLLQQQGWHVFRETYKCPSCMHEVHSAVLIQRELN